LNSGRTHAAPKKPEASLVEGERPRRSNNPGVGAIQRYGEEKKVRNTRRERYLERGKRIPAQQSPWSAVAVLPAGTTSAKHKKGP
jgi:hypothetical protein